MANSADPVRNQGRTRARPEAWAEARTLGLAAQGAPRPVQLGAFFRSRRERLNPTAAGLPVTGRRRTPGIRREDVAALAQISVAWYERIEQGRDVHPSAAALRAIANALRLDPAERAYVFRLASVLDVGPTCASDALTPVLRAVDLVPTPEVPDGTPPALRHLLDGVLSPALLIDRYWDVIGRNAGLTALVPGLTPVRTRPDIPPRNVVRHVLKNKGTHEETREWETLARACVSGLRATLVATWPERSDDPHAAALVEALTHESREFRSWWPEYQVWNADRPLWRVYDHPQVGRVAVEITLLDVRSAPGVTLATFVPADEASAAKLRRLALEQSAPNTRGEKTSGTCDRTES